MAFWDHIERVGDYVRDFAQSRRGELVTEVASRSTSQEMALLIGLLPDPDPVLRKRGEGVEVLDELLGDGHLTSVIQTRKGGTLSKEFQWQPGHVGEAEATSDAIALRDALVADLEDISRQVPLQDIRAQILDAPYYGLTPIELMWRPEGGRLRLTELRPLPARWFGFDEKNQPRFLSMNNPWEGEVLPPGKFVFARHFPTYDNPYGLRLLSRCFWPIAFKRGGMKFWITFAERYGFPFLVGKAPNGAKKEQREEILAQLAKMVQDAVAVVTHGTELEILEATGTRADVHERLKKAMDAEISKVIMGETLTTELGDVGSYAASQTHADVLSAYQDADERLEATTWNQIAWWYAQINAAGVPAPVFSCKEEEDIQKDRAERDKSLKETGVRFTKTYFQRIYNLKEDDFDLVEAAAPPDPAVIDPAKPAFAEPGRPPSPHQMAIDDLVLEQVQAGGLLTLPQAERIIEAVKASVSYEDLLDHLGEAFESTEAGEFERVLQQAMLAADLYGQWATVEDRK